MAVFNMTDYLLKDIDPETPYKEGTVKGNTHSGQRKLCLSLIQFLTNFLKHTNATIVYIGAAPGSNIGIVGELFPNLDWHLYDVNGFDERLTKNPKIKIYKRYFTNKDAEELSKVKNVYFVSDIRVSGTNPELINEDMKLQMEWFNIMKPVEAQLKFRLPFITDGVDIPIEYLDGLIFKQAWSQNASSETRLVPSHNGTKTYSSLTYESQMYHFNMFVRSSKFTFLGYNDTFDTIYEKSILNDYLWYHRTDTIPTNDEIDKLSRYISNVLGGEKKTK